MSRKQVIILVVLGLFVAGGVVFGILTQSERIMGFRDALKQKNSAPDIALEEQIKKPVFTSEVPEDAELSEPKLEAPASANSELDTKIRFFDMRVTKDGFDPKSVTVNKGDTVQIDFTAVDGDYDFDIPYLGAYFSVVEEGTTKRLPFDVTVSGTFMFECRDYCPGGKTISGELIVLP